MTDRPMTPLRHIGEIRVRVLRVSILTLAILLVAFWYYQEILSFFTVPVQMLFKEADVEGGLVVLRFTEAWSVAARIAFLAALAGSLPFYILEIALYLRPALKPAERKYVFLFPPSVLVLFAGGAAFAYYVLVPSFFGFLLSFSAGLEGVELRPSVNSTVGLIISFMFWMGILFQTPIIMLLMSKIGLVTFKDMARRWRWAVLLAFVFGAAITPTVDPVTQVLAALPMVVLYGLGLLLMKLSERKGPNKMENKTAPTVAKG